MNFSKFKPKDDKKIIEYISSEEEKSKAWVTAGELARVIYVCDVCGISAFSAKGKEIICKRCLTHTKIAPDGSLAREGASLPFAYPADLYAYQQDTVREALLSPDVISSDMVAFYDVTSQRRVKILSKGKLVLYADRIIISAPNGEEIEFPFSEVEDVTLSGKGGVCIYYGEGVYYFSGKGDFCAVKYVNIFYKYKVRDGYLGI